MVAAGLFVAAANLVYYGTRMPLFAAVLKPSVLLILVTVIIQTPTLFWDSPYSRGVQLLTVFANAMGAIAARYDSVYGLGLYLLAIFLAFKYHFLTSRPLLKVSLSVVAVLLATFFSAPLPQPGIALISALNAAVYTILFLAISYLILKDEIDEAVTLQRQRLIRPVDLDSFGITPAELRVLEVLVREKASDKEIAAALNLSVGTVKNYVRTIKQKLKIGTRYALIDRCRHNFPAAGEGKRDLSGSTKA